MGNIYKYKEQTMVATYESLTSRRHIHSKPVYMLSELIDNSIASWLKLNGSRYLHIIVEINADENSISVIDNAEGMNKEELENSIRLDNYKKGNVINKFGVGLKNSAFWFGEDLEIWTNNDLARKFCLYTSVITSDKQLSEPVKWIVKEKNDFQGQGTKIRISKLNKGRINQLDYDKFVTKIQPLIERKFYLYLSDKVEISIKFIKNESIKSIKLEPREIKSQVIPENQINKFKEFVNRAFIDYEPRALRNISEKLIKLAENKEPIKFEYSLPIGEKGPFNFTFGVQESSEGKFYKINYGLGTLQQNRYINIPGENVIQIGDYIRTDIKRMWGFVDFGDVFELDNNKRDFDFGEYIDDFKSLKEDLKSDLEKVCACVAKITKPEKVEVGGKNTDLQVTETQLNSKFNFKQNIKWSIKSPDKAELTWEGIPIIIKEESSDDDKSLINYNFDKNNNIVITFNKNHLILKPIVNDVSQESIMETFYPLIAIVGLSSLIRDKKLNPEQISKLLPDHREINEYESIMNLLLEKLLS